MYKKMHFKVDADKMMMTFSNFKMDTCTLRRHNHNTKCENVNSDCPCNAATQLSSMATLARAGITEPINLTSISNCKSALKVLVISANGLTLSSIQSLSY